MPDALNLIGDPTLSLGPYPPRAKIVVGSQKSACWFEPVTSVSSPLNQKISGFKPGIESSSITGFRKS
jgi:hypothetical protein